MTAIAVAREVGIFKDGDLALDGAELEMISDSELSEMLPKVSVYARAQPGTQDKNSNTVAGIGTHSCDDRRRGKRRTCIKEG